ncbi:4'-phosphopantetheinyl transferase superfamily protein [Paenibacillus sp. OK003]|uniref:4'-phosphopantetheinyl transferase family protein n=1 Tax=Paenibacillus sp. OK003 TaxID=1884380 RepID=UPI0008C518C6|nr:4'-phosphopantetheinyl transferase superfamily protein [Paenibacillus sp. OK003]SEL18596.1 4'-phosphopantetheinyl transferase [Paenibacillus sp. OK003]
MPNAGKTEIHLWKQALPISEDQVKSAATIAQATLTPDEQQRMSRIGKSSLLEAHGWMTSRLFLRSVLAQYMQVQARDIQFKYGTSGKPYVQGGPRFSLSHTKGLCVLAVTSSIAELGVDVEWMRPLLRQQAIIERFLTIAEQGYISNGMRKGRERSRLLWEMLTRKEAWVKASGQALCGQWRTLNTVDDHSAKMNLVEREGRSYMLRKLDVGRGYVGALCMEGKVQASIRWMSCI